MSLNGWRMKSGAVFRFCIPVVFLFLLLALLAACERQEREGAIGEGYIGSPTVGLRDRLGPSGTTTATLKAGERVQILQRRRRWARVRAQSGAEGWLDEQRNIIPRDAFEQAQSLLSSAAAMPSQGRARAHAPLNLHLEPARKSPSFFQLKEGEECDVLQHRAVEKPGAGGASPPPEQPGQQTALAAKPEPKTPAATRAPASAKKGKSQKARQAQPSGPPMEDWYLLRAAGKAGWALARMVEMTIPDEVAQYAEGKAITAWHVLDEVWDGGQKKPRYIWATSESVGSPYDFDGIRVFTWNRVRHRYETAYRERNRQGLYPITVGRVELKSGEVPAFSITMVGTDGKRATRNFVLLGNFVRRREQVE